MSVIIYGVPGCIYCDKARALCEVKSLKYEYLTVGQDVTIEQLQERVGQPVRTVPQIFIMSDGFAEYIGGFDALKLRLS